MDLFIQQIFAYYKQILLGIRGTKIKKTYFFSEEMTNLKGEDGC